MLETIRLKCSTRRHLFYRSCLPQVLSVNGLPYLDLIRERIATRRHLYYRNCAPQIVSSMTQAPIGKLDVARLNTITSGEGGSAPCSCKGKTCVCKSEAGTVEMKAETQLAFLDKVNQQTVQPTGISRTLASIIEATVKRNIRLKPLFDVNGERAGELETVPNFVCDACDPLLRVTYRKKGCKACGDPLRNAETAYVDSPLRESKRNGELVVAAHNTARRDKVTNARLFCRGDKETDSFSRTMALKYLAKRMVHAKRSNAKAVGRPLVDAASLLGSQQSGPIKASKALPMGKEPKRTGKASSASHDAKVSSNAKHYKQAKASAFCASDVEDVVNDAWVVFTTGESIGVDGKVWKLTLTGNRLHDTCNACRLALQRWQRETYKQTLDIVHYEYQERQNDYRGDINVILRAEDVQRMLDVVRVTGSVEQATIAKALGISQPAVSKRFAQLRRRILNER